VTHTSVISIVEATEIEFSKAEIRTIVGSIIPILNISPSVSVAKFVPKLIGKSIFNSGLSQIWSLHDRFYRSFQQD